MPLTIEAKKALVDEVSQVAASAHSAVAADYRGLTVAEMKVTKGSSWSVTRTPGAFEGPALATFKL